MSQYWNQRTQRLQPYTPGEQPQDQRYIKLNTNEFIGEEMKKKNRSKGEE